MASQNESLERLRGPLAFAKWMWPQYQFYPQQEEVILSVRDNDETFVTAGHQLGKDFVTGFIAVWFFLTHHPCRVITTSVKDDHLRVLWGEMGRFIQTARYPLEAEKGGPLICNHRDIRKIVKGEICPISYLRGCVSEKGEAMAGHHAQYTLAIFDESSGIEDVAYERVQTWAKRILCIGNPYDPDPAVSSFFKKAVQSGNLLPKEYTTLSR